ncbi:MAG: PQQ-binding-like beta-propeller repeat protein, partial [Gemmatimonadota bacterium]|nr:PQQ-binding-like beta-propeller repeat protein [Gemmatimonadota bacterium]
MAVDLSDHVITVGRAQNETGTDDFYMARINGINGALMWDMRIDGADGIDDTAWDVEIAPDGNPVATGVVFNSDGTASTLTAKVSVSDGSVLWSRTIPGAVHAQGRMGWIGIDAAGDCIVANRIWESATSYDVTLVKFDGSTGATIWSTRYNGAASGSDDPRGMTLDAAGNAIVCGVSMADYMIVGFDGATGSVLWEASYDGPPGWYDSATQVEVGPGGEVVVSGFSDGTGSSWDMATVCLDGQTGTEQWVMRFNGADSMTDEAFAVAFGSDGDLFVGGY